MTDQIDEVDRPIAVFRPTPSPDRPEWTYPGPDLLEVCRQGRREIEIAEGFVRPSA